MIPIIYTLGEILVEIMRPHPGQSLHHPGEFLGPFPSGAPGIFISTAARLGARTAIIAGVGKDKFGENILERLRRDAVDPRQIHRSSKATAVAFVAYEPDGEREFIYHIGGTAATDLPEIEASLAALPKPDAFHVMGCSLMASEVMRRGIVQAVEYYRDAEISFDPNLRPELLQGRRFTTVAGEVMQHCNILLPGEAELLLAAGLPLSCSQQAITQAVERLFSRYPKLRLIHLKLGVQGSRIYTRNESKIIEIPRYPIEKIMPILDPTGAGDCFDAAFITALLAGESLEKAGFLAAKAGALNVAAFGPMEGDMSLLRKILVSEDEPWLAGDA